MKFTIDVPEPPIADLTDPSPELSSFLRQFRDLCIDLTTRFKTVEGDPLFTAYVREGATTVFCTAELRTAPIQGSLDTADDEESEYRDDEESLKEQAVYMNPDLPGKWIVARFHISGWAASSVTLYSTDFEKDEEEDQPIAQELLQRISRYLAKQSHKVPRPDQ